MAWFLGQALGAGLFFGRRIFLADLDESVDKTDDALSGLVTEVNDIVDEIVDEVNTEVSEELENELSSELKDAISDEDSSHVEKHKSVFSNSLKFFLLIFLEVLIFHFAVRTNSILKGQKKEAFFKDFSHAQLRMIKVMGLKWALGLACYIVVTVALSIAQIRFVTPYLMYFVYAYFIGFAFLDNYMEQFGYTIRESSRTIQTHFGAAVTLGVIAGALMHIPLVGPLVTPFICAIAATRYGHQVKMENYIPEKVETQEEVLSFHSR